MLEKRGAIGLPLAQLIAKHLISACAYLHVRGVMHRDIKPDNIMLEGCKVGWVDDDLMWSNGSSCKNAVRRGRFKAVLSDFGFARATSPEDYNDKKKSGIFNSFIRRKSRIILRNKSAVGTKHFAAPEVEGTVHKKHDSDSALTECVSSYALISDAYSIGATLSELTTGVPPGQNIKEYVNANRKQVKASPLQKFTKKLGEVGLGAHKKGGGPYDIQLRHLEELPDPISDLITSLMKKDVDSRLSVREAQDHKWIGGYNKLPQGDVPSHPDAEMVYLQNALAFK